MKRIKTGVVWLSDQATQRKKGILINHNESQISLSYSINLRFFSCLTALLFTSRCKSEIFAQKKYHQYDQQYKKRTIYDDTISGSLEGV